MVIRFKTSVSSRKTKFLARSRLLRRPSDAIMAFFGFLAGAALGGLAGYALGAWTRPAWCWHPYYYALNYYPTPCYLPYHRQAYPVYIYPYGWHPWYGYW
jgi:ABC-type nitrate/sulfonate/bicarbonate transport system permease component